MQGGYIAALFFLCAFFIYSVVAAGANAERNSSSEKYHRTRVLLNYTSILFLLLLLLTIIFLGLYFQGLTPIASYQVTSQGALTGHAGNSTIPATYQTVIHSIDLTSSLSNAAECSIFFDTQTECDAVTIAASKVVGGAGCSCYTSQVPLTYIQKYAPSRVFTVQNTETLATFQITLLSTDYTYADQTSVTSDNASLVLPSGVFWMNQAQATNFTIDSISEFSEYTVDASSLQNQFKIGKQASTITGFLAVGLLVFCIAAQLIVNHLSAADAVQAPKAVTVSPPKAASKPKSLPKTLGFVL